MSSKTSLIAQQVRIQQWASQIQECQNRPTDMDVTTWCEQNDIAKATYYYRLKKVREAILKKADPEQTAFVEIPIQEGTHSSVSSAISETAAVMHTPNGVTIELCNSASSEFLRKLMEAFSYAQ